MFIFVCFFEEHTVIDLDWNYRGTQLLWETIYKADYTGWSLIT